MLRRARFGRTLSTPSRRGTRQKGHASWNATALSRHSLQKLWPAGAEATVEPGTATEAGWVWAGQNNHGTTRAGRSSWDIVSDGAAVAARPMQLWQG